MENNKYTLLLLNFIQKAKKVHDIEMVKDGIDYTGLVDFKVHTLDVFPSYSDFSNYKDLVFSDFFSRFAIDYLILSNMNDFVRVVGKCSLEEIEFFESYPDTYLKIKVLNSETIFTVHFSKILTMIKENSAC